MISLGNRHIIIAKLQLHHADDSYCADMHVVVYLLCMCQETLLCNAIVYYAYKSLILSKLDIDMLLENILLI